MSTMTMGRPMERPMDRLLAARQTRRRQRSTVRLTRRGRVVVFVVGLMALLGLGLAVSAGAGAALHGGAPEPTHQVVVAPGDTLWGLASDAADGGDVRSMITHIEELNGLAGADLSVGQTLRIPN
jgi:hypothetical protein